jgi:predicted Zn-dependent protease
MRISIRGLLLFFGLLVVAGGAAFFAIRLEPWISPEAAFKKAETNYAMGNYAGAFRYVKMASNKKPGDAQYAWAATQFSETVHNINAAYFFAQRAWKDGRKERDVLQSLVQFSFFSDKKQRLDYALSLIGQMGANVDKEDLRAEIYEIFGEIDKARQLREELFNRTPLPALATKLGRLLLKAGRDSLAFSFLQSCRERQKLDDEGFTALARLFVKRGNLKEAELCFQEAGATDKSSGKLEYDHALFLMATKNFDRAAFMLDSLVAKYPENKNLETARISVFMAKGDFNGALRECEKSSAPAGLIAPLRARALLRLNRPAEAEVAFDTACAHTTDLHILLEFGNFLMSQINKSDKASAIFQSVLKKIPNEPVASLGLATIALNAKDYALARKRVDGILATKNPTPLAHILLGQVNLAERKPQAAIECCDKALAAVPGLEKALFIQALSYDLLGKLEKSDEMLTSLIPKQAGDPEQLAMTKRALVTVKTKEKKFQEALKLIDELDPLKKTPEQNRIRVEIYALSGNYAKADETLASIKASMQPDDFLFYKSWLFELRGDILGAAKILEPQLSSKSNALRWAELRMKAGKFDGIMERLPKDSMNGADWNRIASVADKTRQFAFSAQCYKNIVKLNDGNAAALNNFVYASMQTPGFNQEEILNAAQKAYMGLPNRPEVLQTYAEALIKCGKPTECIKLLKDKPSLVKLSANLLYLIGSAYETTGDFRGAVTSYNLAVSFPESTSDLPPEVSRNDLARRVEKLKATIRE